MMRPIQLARKLLLSSYVFVAIFMLSMADDALAQDASTWLPPARDTSQIVLDHEETVGGFGSGWELDYFRV